jgi:transcriptional regulator with XRE-family HTH domain
MKITKKISTQEFIKKAENEKIDEYLEDVPKGDVSNDTLFEFINTHGNLSPAEIAKRAGIDDSYFRKIYNRERKHPARDLLILIGRFGIGLNLSELQYLLKRYGCSELSPNNGERDAIIVYGICNGKSKEEINEDLNKKNHKMLNEDK